MWGICKKNSVKQGLDYIFFKYRPLLEIKLLFPRVFAEFVMMQVSSGFDTRDGVEWGSSSPTGSALFSN